MSLVLPDSTNLYDLLAQAGKGFEAGSLKKVAVFLGSGKRFELELLDGRSHTLCYRSVQSQTEQKVDYKDLSEVKPIVAEMYDACAGGITQMQSARSTLIQQSFVRLYGASITSPVVYRYQTQGNKFYRVS